MCCRMNPCRVAPRVKAYKGLADPKSAESIHMCVAEQMMHLRVTCYQGLADQQLLLAHTHKQVWCRIRQFKTAPNIQRLQRFRRPSAAASIHMRIAEVRAGTRGRNFIKASPRAYTRALQTRSFEGCTRGPRITRVTRVRPTAASIHMCAAK